MVVQPHMIFSARKPDHFAGHDVSARTIGRFAAAALWIGGASLAAVLIWQAFAARGNPNPLDPNADQAAAVLDIGVLVFRERLECILVLAAVTAGMVGSSAVYRRPVAAGVGVGVFATLVTWQIAIGVIDDLSNA